MLPALFRKSETANKSAFTRALERFRKNRALAREQLEEKRALEAARKLEEIFQSAAKPDEITVRGRCTVTGRYYRTLYRRAPEDGKFVPVGQFKEESSGYGSRQRSAVANDATIATTEFRHWSRLPCPWCRKRFVHSQIRCDRCKQHVCTGRGYVDSDGTLMHLCHEDCGNRGPVGRPRDSVHVERNAPQRGASRKALVPQGRSVPTLAAALEPPRRRKP